MQNDVATTRYYNILIKSSQPSPARAAAPTTTPAAKPTITPAVNLRPRAVPPKNAMNDSPLSSGRRSQDDGLQESVALPLPAEKMPELNQLVTELKSKLADAESERQALKLQAKLVYGLVSEITSLRAITDTSKNDGNLMGVSATQGPVRNRKKDRRLKEWKDSLVIACLLMSTLAATTFVMENIPQPQHSLFSPR